MRARIAHFVCGCTVYGRVCCRLHRSVHVQYIRFGQSKTPGFVTGHFPKAFRLALEPTHLVQCAPRAISSMAKRREREADYSSPYPAAVRNRWMYSYISPYTFKMCTDFSLLKNFRSALGLTIFLGSQCRGVKLPTNLHRMPRLRMNEINTSASTLCFRGVQRELLRCSQ